VITLAQGGNQDIGLVEHGNMKKILITEKQFNKILSTLKEGDHETGSYMAKQQLFTIATLAYKMWEMMEDGEELEDWMETKIAQSELTITSVVKSYMYDEIEDAMKKTDGLDLDDLIIGT
jgi:hypothetical protein